MEYRRVVGIIYNKKHFEIFKDSEARYAILEYNDEKKEYHFPILEDLVNIIDGIIPKEGLQFMQSRPHKRKMKKYRFKNFVKIPLTIGTVLLSTSLLLSYVNQEEIDAIFDYISINDKTELVASSNNELVDEDLNNYDLGTLYSDDISSIDPSLLSSDNKYYTVDELDKVITVTNTAALDELLGYQNVTVDQITERINEKQYTDEYKNSLIDFVKTMDTHYNHEVDFRIFFENLKTLIFRPFPKSEQTENNIAYYDYINNVIYISPDLDFNNEYDMVIFRHELGHVITSGYFYLDNGYRIKKTFFGKHQDGMYTNEALTVLFTTNPFLDRYSDETKENMGYPLATNIYRPVIQFMDNYSLAEMSKTDIYYFTQKMNKQYGSFLSATSFVDKVEFQINQFYNNDFIVLEQDSHYIYEAIADIYLSFGITSDMSVDDLNDLREQIKSELNLGVTNRFKQNLSGVDDAFDEYIENLNNKKTR